MVGMVETKNAYQAVMGKSLRKVPLEDGKEGTSTKY
jgi:hypothetical protein